MRRIILVLPLLWPGIPACNPDAAGERADTGVAGSAAPAAPVAAPPGVTFHGVGSRPRAIAAADLNRDQRIDVVVGNAGDGTASVLFGDGEGRFREPVSFAAGPEPADVDALDLDRDGDLDLVFANHETSLVTVLLNDGSEGFSPAPGSPFDTGARPHIHGVATGDVDGDGWQDVAVESSGANEVRVLRGGERGLAPAIAVPVGTMPYSRLGIGQVTGKGLLDILVPGNRDNTVRAIESVDGALREAAWTIQLAAQPWMVAGGDVNGDRRDDIAVVETDGLSVWLAGDRGFAGAPGSPFSIPGATELAMGDLDGDGVADIAVGPWDGDEVTVLTQRLSARRKVRMCERPFGLAIADLDGDGRGELLAACTNRNSVAVTTVAPR